MKQKKVNAGVIEMQAIISYCAVAFGAGYFLGDKQYFDLMYWPICIGWFVLTRFWRRARLRELES